MSVLGVIQRRPCSQPDNIFQQIPVEGAAAMADRERPNQLLMSRESILHLPSFAKIARRYLELMLLLTCEHYIPRRDEQCIRISS